MSHVNAASTSSRTSSERGLYVPNYISKNGSSETRSGLIARRTRPQIERRRFIGKHGKDRIRLQPADDEKLKIPKGALPRVSETHHGEIFNPAAHVSPRRCALLAASARSFGKPLYKSTGRASAIGCVHSSPPRKLWRRPYALKRPQHITSLHKGSLLCIFKIVG